MKKSRPPRRYWPAWSGRCRSLRNVSFLHMFPRAVWASQRSSGMAWMAHMVKHCLGGPAPPSALSPSAVSRRFGRVGQLVSSSSWSNDGTKQTSPSPCRRMYRTLGSGQVREKQRRCKGARGTLRGYGPARKGSHYAPPVPGPPRLAQAHPLHHVVSFDPSSFDFDCLLQRTLLGYTSASGI